MKLSRRRLAALAVVVGTLLLTGFGAGTAVALWQQQGTATIPVTTGSWE